MGADRRGPLAAFIIVAVIAAILLVTSVRSQAAPWLVPGRISASVAGPALEPHLWGSVTGGVDGVVQAGAVLVHKAADTDEPTRTTQTTVASRVIRPEHGRTTGPTSRHVPARRHHHPPRPHGPSRPEDTAPVAPAEPADPPAQAPTPPVPPAGLPGRHDHGRHLGWLKHHDQPAPPDPVGPPTTE